MGMDAETAVSDDYKQEDNQFTGAIVKVTIDVSPSKLSTAAQKPTADTENAAELAVDRPFADLAADAQCPSSVTRVASRRWLVMSQCALRVQKERVFCHDENVRLRDIRSLP